ncbi:MAG: Subtilisin-like protein serine protease [Candidatus Peregrinibacteria bacterium GW2011_GWA2_33_10]|nr:MAG: Subtilisin-like protein serine protease [Candidatus Peregrinibacteria bacterium GW2011_GWA2_33_10]KKP41102.1 MAG: subtilisin-like protein serine protease [Candidatus Peregrinibacteria bacterium GW2011_GWC2_33_13]OGJ49809.1 MAG: hypothetical protein A2229_00770 [Candidatus Peregrinibacteria bacterium RIFOXYA2_FULL_33_7]
MKKLYIFLILLTFIFNSGFSLISSDDTAVFANIYDNKIRNYLKEYLDNVSENDILPLIVTLNKGLDNEIINNLKTVGKIRNKFDNINAIAIYAPAKAVNILAKFDKVKNIEYDLELSANLESSKEVIGTDKVILNNQITGNGVSVAILDTGIEDKFIPLQGKVIQHVDFTGTGLKDKHGHGTHVACIVACDGEDVLGNAPKADLYDVKVLDSTGVGDMSEVMAGVQWAITKKVDIINLSLGTQIDNCDGEDALSKLLNLAVDKGIVVVTASGNSGPYAESINLPGCASKPITVGAVNDAGKVARFSSRGPTSNGQNKPDVMAPGVNITSLWYDGSFKTVSGTSQAAPHVAGVAALIKEMVPDISPTEIKYILMNTGYDMILSNLNTDSQKIVNAAGSIESFSNKDNNNTNDEKYEIIVLPVSSDDLLRAREEWNECTLQSKNNDEIKQDCLKQFLEVQYNYQLNKLDSEEINSLGKLRKTMDEFKNTISQENSDIDLKKLYFDLVYEIQNYIFIDNYANDLDNLINSWNEDLINNKKNLSQSDFDNFKSQIDKIYFETTNRKYNVGLIPFKDVDDPEWFFSYVYDIKNLQCVSGFEDENGQALGVYKPESYLTIAESLKILLECTNKTQIDENQENNIVKDHWAKEYYLMAKELNLSIVDTIDSQEDLDRQIKRGEFVLEMIEVAGIPFLQEYDAVFSDVPKNNVYADAIYTSYYLGIVSGDSDKNLFRPNDPLNRAEISKIVLAVNSKY